MIEAIGAGTLVYGPTQTERAGALQAALPELRLLGLGDRELGPDLLAARRQRVRCRSAPPPRARRRHPRPVHLGHDRHAQGRPAYPGDLRSGRPQCPDQPDRSEARRDHAPRRLDDPRQRHLRPALLAARRRGGDPAGLRARRLCRGDRALAPGGAQPRPDHVADAVPVAGDRGGRPLLGRDDPLRRLADAAAGARKGASAVGPGLRPILRPDRSAARHRPADERGACRRQRGAAALLRSARATNARSGWSTRRARTCRPASPARSCFARPS